MKKNNSTFHTPHSTFPIDLVYLWVDGADPKWLAKKNAALAAAGKNTVSLSAVTGRFDDNDELLFSLRSVEMFMPWINHVYIVTDNQTPKWLNTKNPKVTVINQNDIVPAEYLPLFNSGAIEMFLGNIPGLSEHFIYANDDMMVGRPIGPEFFFDENGNPIVILREKRRQRTRSMIGSQIANARELVFRATGKKYFMTLTHAMDAARKSQWTETMTTFWATIESTTMTTFRMQKNIQRIFNSFYNNALGRNTIVLPWRVGARRIVVGANEPWWRTIWRRMVHLFCPVKYDFCDVKDICITNVLTPAMFCINNGKLFAVNAPSIRKKYPIKSQFEK